MSDPNDELFDDVVKGKKGFDGEVESIRQASYESAIVKRILTTSGFKPSRWSGVVSQSREFTGDQDLNFAWFHEAYPAFPVTMMSEKIRWAHKTRMIDFFKRFTSTLVYCRFRDRTAEAGINLRDTYAALVFEMGEFGTTVIHNYPRETQFVLGDGCVDEGTRLIRPLKVTGVTYVVEQVKTFIAAIGASWVP